MIATKWLIAGGAGVAAVIAAIVYYVAKSGGGEADSLKLRLDLDKKKFYQKGFAEGEAQGTATSGKEHNPVVTVNEAETSLPKEASWAVVSALAPDKRADYVRSVQQSYENGVNDGYESKWKAPEPVTVSTETTTPTPKEGGMKAGQSAYDYGCSRGGSRGWDDGYNGRTCDPESYLETDGSKKRQAESGDPVAYRKGYTTCYKSKCVAGAEAKAVADVFEGDGGFGGGFFTGTETSGAPSRPLLSVGALRIGFEPQTGSLISVGRRRLLGLRAPIGLVTVERGRQPPNPNPPREGYVAPEVSRSGATAADDGRIRPGGQHGYVTPEAARGGHWTSRAGEAHSIFTYQG